MLVRALSAVLGVALIYGVWYQFSTSGLATLCSLVSFIACCEFSAMADPASRLNRSIFAVICFAFHMIFSFYTQSFLVFIGFFLFLVTYFILLVREPLEKRFNKLSSWMMGMLYCGFLTGIVVIGLRELGGHFFVALLMVSFLTDTFAYLGGRLVGKKPLAPFISPKKTREGALVGLIGGATITFYYLKIYFPDANPLIILGYCCSASLVSQVGDLFESMIKRNSGVKDSGRLIPGHGGVLDRIDGLLFAAPIIYSCIDQMT